MSQSSYVDVLLRSSPAKPARSPLKVIETVKAKRFRRTVGTTAANSANIGGVASIGAVYLTALLAFFAGNADVTSLGEPREYCRSEVLACQVCTRSHLVWSKQSEGHII